MDLNDLLAEFDSAGPVPTPVAPAPSAPAAAAAALVVTAEDVPASLSMKLPPLADDAPAARPAFPSLDLILDVELELMVEIGQVRLPLRKLMSIQPGEQIMLDGRADTPLRILVNDRVVAHGEALVIDGSLAVRLTKLLPTGTED